jgi:hypothetical protein
MFRVRVKKPLLDEVPRGQRMIRSIKQGEERREGKGCYERGAV